MWKLVLGILHLGRIYRTLGRTGIVSLANRALELHRREQVLAAQALIGKPDLRVVRYTDRLHG